MWTIAEREERGKEGLADRPSNVWSGGALPVIVTVVGWLTLIKGVLCRVRRRSCRQLRYLSAELVSRAQQNDFWRSFRRWPIGCARMLAQAEACGVGKLSSGFDVTQGVFEGGDDADYGTVQIGCGWFVVPLRMRGEENYVIPIESPAYATGGLYFWWLDPRSAIQLLGDQVLGVPKLPGSLVCDSAEGASAWRG